jgi:hypothetical protein
MPVKQAADNISVIKNSMLGLIKAYTINHIDKKYKTSLSEEYFLEGLRRLRRQSGKSNGHAAPNSLR